MMLIDESRTALFALSDLASGNPDPVSVLKVQADLVRLHLLVGEEMCRKYSAKERSYLARKLAQAKSYQHGRMELKMTGGDASEAALLASGEDYTREIDAAAEYESYRILLKSIQNAIDVSRQLVSFYRGAEANQPNS